jgi:uncharacterized membrane protein YoaT (DUF817 family)
MPLLVGLGLVALFIWFAENIGTLARAWHYPNQKLAWEPVPLTKLGSWFLLMIISYTLVAVVNGVARYRGRVTREPSGEVSSGIDLGEREGRIDAR